MSLLSIRLRSNTFVFLRKMVAPPVSCSFTHLMGYGLAGFTCSIFTVG